MDTVQRDYLTNLTTRAISFSVLSCSGLDGLGSTEVQLWGLISELSRLVLSQIQQLQLAV